jgi:hypothetical protein
MPFGRMCSCRSGRIRARSSSRAVCRSCGAAQVARRSVATGATKRLGEPALVVHLTKEMFDANSPEQGLKKSPQLAGPRLRRSERGTRHRRRSWAMLVGRRPAPVTTWPTSSISPLRTWCANATSCRRSIPFCGQREPPDFCLWRNTASVEARCGRLAD